MSIVKTEQLTKIYGTGATAVTALSHLNINVESGEFVAVMGPSGCGKSTLLHLLGGLDRPSEGKVLIEDVSIADMSDDRLTELRRRKIGSAAARSSGWLWTASSPIHSASSASRPQQLCHFTALGGRKFGKHGRFPIDNSPFTIRH